MLNELIRVLIWVDKRATLPLSQLKSKLFLPSALVDPGHFTIPFCDDPEVVGRGAAYGESTEKIKLYLFIFVCHLSKLQCRGWERHRVKVPRDSCWQSLPGHLSPAFLGRKGVGIRLTNSFGLGMKSPRPRYKWLHLWSSTKIAIPWRWKGNSNSRAVSVSILLT